MDRFNGSFQSERASLKVSQLERKWQQILEEERRSCLRNKKLLDDFGRIDQQSKVFSRKSDSLKQAKYNFELYVKSVYPRWTQELKQLQEVERKKASKVIRPPSLLSDKGGYREKKHSENILGYVVDSENVPLNPTFSSTPNRNGVSLMERERLTNSEGSEERNQRVMPEHRGYNQHYPTSAGYPLRHPMANLSQDNSRGWSHPEAMPYGMFPYMGHYSLPRPHYVMPWKNLNHPSEDQARYGYDPNGIGFHEMPGNAPPPWSSQKFDYQRDPLFVENFHGNNSEARLFQQAYRDQRDDRYGINQALRNSQGHHDVDPTPRRNDSRSAHRKEESYEDNNREQPNTRNGLENYTGSGNHRTFQEKLVKERIEHESNKNDSTDLKDNLNHHELIEDSSRDESTHEKSSVGEYAKEGDAEPKVMKDINTEILNKSTDVKINGKNSGGSLRKQVYNPSVNHEPTDNTQHRREKQNDKDKEELHSLSPITNQESHNEHSVKEQMSNNEIPESDIDSTLPNGPKDKGSQDLSRGPTGSAQVDEMKSAKSENSSEKEIPRKEEAKTSDIMDDLLPDDVSEFEISGSDISEDAHSEHEIITSNQKECVQVSENSTEKSGSAPEMNDLEVQDDELISKPRKDSVSDEHSDTKEPINIDDGKTVANTETELLTPDKREPTNIHDSKAEADTETASLSQDKKEPTDIHDPKTEADTEQNKRESFSEPKEKEERNEPKENDFHLDRKDEPKDSHLQDEISDDFDVLSDRHDEEQRDDEKKSKSEVLEDLSFTSAEDSSSESISLKKKSDSKKSEKKNETKESVSYSEDFEDEKSIPLTETDAYQKMLSNVNVSDEEDIEEDLLGGSTMSEANIVGQTKQDHDNTQQSPRQQPVSQPSSISKKPTKVSKSKPKLSVFSSGEGDAGLENSLGKDSEGILTWKSSEPSLSPPLSPDMDLGGYVPTVVADKKVEGKETKETVKRMKGAEEKEQGKVEKETGKEKQGSKTRSRIQAGFWNHSDSESEVDLQVSHGPDDNGDDDDDFDFYS